MAPLESPSTSPAVESSGGQSRRTFLQRAVIVGFGAAVVAGTGVVALVRTGGYAIDPARTQGLRVLSPWQLAVVDALLARICLADVPYDSLGAPPTPREVGAAEFVDAFLASSDSSDSTVRRDCTRLIGFVEHTYPLLCGHAHRFTALDPGAQDGVLARLESSSVDLFREAFGALKSLMMMAYYRDPRTWGLLDYDGPLEHRPDRGWTPLRFVPPERRPT